MKASVSQQDLCAPGLPPSLKAIKLAPRSSDVRIGMVGCLIARSAFDSARATARKGIEYGGPPIKEYRRLIGVADSLEQAPAKPASPSLKGR